MQNRPTTELTTPNGHKIVLKDWITGREFESLSAPLLKLYKINASKGAVEEPAVGGDVMTEMNKQALIVWVESVNGSTENIYDTLLDMRQEDYLFVKTAIDGLSKKK